MSPVFILLPYLARLVDKSNDVQLILKRALPAGTLQNQSYSLDACRNNHRRSHRPFSYIALKTLRVLDPQLRIFCHQYQGSGNTLWECNSNSRFARVWLDKVTATASLWNCFISFTLFAGYSRISFLQQSRGITIYLHTCTYVCMYVQCLLLVASQEFSLQAALDNVVALANFRGGADIMDSVKRVQRNVLYQLDYNKAAVQLTAVQLTAALLQSKRVWSECFVDF